VGRPRQCRPGSIPGQLDRRLDSEGSVRETRLSRPEQGGLSGLDRDDRPRCQRVACHNALRANDSDLQLAIHGMDLVGGDSQNLPLLIAPAVPLVRATDVAPSEQLTMLCSTFGTGVCHAPSDGEVAGWVVGIADGDGHSRVSIDVAHLLVLLNCIDDYVITISVDPRLGCLWRAIRHQRGNET
jgi:hypothetical protein